MRHAPASAPGAESTARQVLADYAGYLAASGRGHVNSERVARSFLRRYPDSQRFADQPLVLRLAE
ncbi:MAG TPA: hypothetical protein VMD59_00540, partial [Acidimicrobiales bacterium]|nr:hypothetical protein [Acidimicrobiales bacterium]